MASGRGIGAGAAAGLVIIGDDDKMTPPRAGMAVAESLTDVRQRRLPGCGHSMLSEKPNEVLDELAGFLVL